MWILRNLQSSVRKHDGTDITNSDEKMLSELKIPLSWKSSVEERASGLELLDTRNTQWSTGREKQN